MDSAQMRDGQSPIPEPQKTTNSQQQCQYPRPSEDTIGGTSSPSETTPLLSNDINTTPTAPRADPETPFPPDHDQDDDENGTYTAELSLLTKYSLPLIATYLLQYSHSVITTYCAGHISPLALAASAIALTTMNITGAAFFEGMATALDTLCAQAHGSGNTKGVGFHVQRMIILMLATSIPVGCLWAASPQILRLLVKQSELADLAGRFLQVSLVGLPGQATYEAVKRFLQAQGIFRPGLMVILLCTPLNALLSWLFAFRMGMGLDGAALGAAISTLLRPVLLVGYIASPWARDARTKCWGGLELRRAIFGGGWGPGLRLSAAGSAVNIGEWAAFEIIGFSASYLSTAHLAAQSVLTTVSIVAWHIPFSVSVAASTRMGHLIGGGHLRTARKAAILYGVVFLVLGVLDGAVLMAFRNVLPWIFTDDREVVNISIRSMASVAAFQVVDSVMCGTNGVLRGLGRQAFAAWVVFIINYAGSVPLAIWLELGPPGWELNGVWLGLLFGMVIVAAVEVLYMRLIRWQKCVDSAKEREESE